MAKRSSTPRPCEDAHSKDEAIQSLPTCHRLGKFYTKAKAVPLEVPLVAYGMPRDERSEFYVADRTQRIGEQLGDFTR